MLEILLMTAIFGGQIGLFEAAFVEVGAEVCRQSDGNFPNSGNCSTFVRCKDRVFSVQSCPDGLLFNPFLSTCDFSKTGNCSDDEDFDTTSRSVETQDIACTSEGPLVEDDEENGCSNIYYLCQNETAYRIECPLGLLFNEVKMTCDYPSNTGCDCQTPTVPESPSTVTYRLCEQNDFLAKLNCSEYTDCSGNYSIEKTCPEGLHFNPTTRVCDWPSNARCGIIPFPLYPPEKSFHCPCKSCLVPSSESCSDYFFCLGNTAYRLTCSTNLQFDRNLNTCNYAGEVECAVATTTVSNTKKFETSSLFSELPTAEATETPKEPSTKATRLLHLLTTIPTTETTRGHFTTAATRIFTCPSREGLFKHPTDCAKFIQCSNWYPYEMLCPETTHFSQITNRCDSPCSARCNTSLACESSTARPMDNQCSCRDCKLPSSRSCTHYIWCTNGKARPMKCRNGQTFDRERGVCDWADRVRCERSEMCPASNGMFPDKEDCHRFVQCLNGIPYVRKCDFVLEFDPESQRCEWPAGRCNNSPVDKEFDFGSEEKTRGFKCPRSFGYFSHESHCGKFYRCGFGTPILKECSKGLLYNPRYQTCDWEKHVRCDTNRHYQPKGCRMYYPSIACQTDRKPLSHDKCNLYYDCTTGRACAKQCPVGLKFNRTTGICDLPQLVECHGPEKSDDDSLRRFSKKCSESGAGHAANPLDETCYYRCRQGRVTPGCCTRGRVYDETKNKCVRGRKLNRK